MYIDHAPEIEKLDISILKILLSSFVLNNTSSFFWPKLNIRVYFCFNFEDLSYNT